MLDVGALAVDKVTGSTGHFTSFGVGSLTGASGYFQMLAVGALALDKVTGSTGHFTSFGVESLTGGTGYFGNVITSKIGINAGATGQNTNAIAIGNNAGQINQGTGSIAIGYLAGSTEMTANSIALNASGKYLSATGATGGFYVAPIASYSGSVGPFTLLAYGQDNQVVGITGDGLTKLGIVGGSASVTGFSVQIGAFAGMTGQGTGSIAIGMNAAQYYQATGAIAMGINSAQYYQGTGAIAIGMNAGQTGQGQNSIAIGNFAGPTSMTQNSIALNASQNALSATGPTGGFFVAPIAPFTNSTGPFNILAYGPDNQIVTVTGTNGLNLSLSTPTFTSDLWSLTNLVNQPPPVTLTVDKTTTTDIYITFSYPRQVYSWLSASGLLPYINNVFVNLYSNHLPVSDTPNPQHGVTGTTYLSSNSSDFIASTTDPSNIVQCINVTSSADKIQGGKKVSPFPHKNLKTYVIPYSQLPAGKAASLYLWYTNSVANPSINVASVSFSYNVPQPPTQVTNLVITPGPSTVTVTFSFTGSSQADSSDPSSTELINYAIKYQPVADSNPYRYGGVVDTTIRDYTTKLNNTGYGPNGSFSNTILNNIYPSTRYVVTVNASNENPNAQGAFTGTTGISDLTPSPVIPAQTVNSNKLIQISTLQSSSSLKSAKSIYGWQTIGNLLTTKDSAPTLPNLSYNVHNVVASTGSTGSNLVNFTTSLYGFTGPNGTVTDINGSSLSLNGFSGSYNYSAGQVNGITISADIVDQYAGTSTGGYTGYYLKSTVNVAFDGSTLIPNSNLYTLSVTGTYASTNSGFVNANYTQFYYDGEQIAPFVNSTNNTGFTGGFVSTNSLQICGVTGISRYNTSSVEVESRVGLVTSVTGIGRYFYNNNRILQYYAPSKLQQFTNTTQETDLTNLTSGFGPSGFKDNNVFTNNNLLTYPTAYNNSAITFRVIAYNVAERSSEFVYSDGKKYLMFDSTLSLLANSQRQSGAGNIPEITMSAVDGIRLWSCNPGYENASENSNSNAVLNTFTNAGASYSTISPFFDHSQSLVGPTGSGELILSENGTYKSGNDVDYNSSFYTSTDKNILNYSSLSTSKLYSLVNNYRYATFAWRLPANPSTAINFITINLANTSPLTDNGTSWYTDSGKLFLYYRVEDIDNKNNWSTGGTISTPWIDGNSFDNTYANNGGYSHGQTYPSTTQNVNTPTPMANTTQTGRTLSGLTSAASGTSVNTSFRVKLPNPISQYNKNANANAMFLYVRIGINMTDTFSFGNPTAFIPANQEIGNGFPSTGVAFTGATPVTTVGTFQINSTFTTPTPTFFTDTNAQLGYVNSVLVGSPTINFNYTYTPVSNSVRANGVYNTTPVDVTGISTTVTTSSSYSIPQTAVYPDTIYKVKGISVTNSSGLTTPVGGSEVTIATATSGFDITYFNGKNYTSSNSSNVLSTTVTNIYHAKFVSNRENITNHLISTKTGTTTLSTTDIGPINVHNSYSTRGSSTTLALVTLSASFTNGGSDTMTIKGFGTTITPSTASIIKINTPTITDLGTNQYSGYYNSATGVTVSDGAAFSTTFLSTPDINPYNLTLTVTYPNTNNGIASGGSANSNPVELTYTSPNYYYDGEMVKPTATLLDLTIDPSNFTKISGISVYNNTSAIPLNYTLSATGLGRNFYNANQTVVYSSNIGTVSRQTETSFSNFSTTNTINYTAPLSYMAQPVILYVTPYNIVNNPRDIKDTSTSADTVSSTTTIIYDPLSISGLITTIPTLSTSVVKGCRIFTSLNAGTFENNVAANISNINTFTNSGEAYYNTLFNNSASILTTNDLLYANGMYVTPSYSQNYYIEYNAGPNYSTISSSTSRRYITFAWKVDPFIFDQASTYGTLTFSMTGVNGITIVDNLAYTNNGNDLLDFWYRVEDTNSLSIASAGKTTTTYWINANSSSGSLITANNCNTGNAPSTTYFASNNGVSLSENICTFPAKTGGYTFSSASSSATSGPGNSVSPVYIYCRVGVSLQSNFSFTDMNCLIST